MKLIVIIPAYNEEKTIGKVIKSVPRKIKGVSEIEILVWSDGSTDGTLEIAKKAGADYVFFNKINLGLAKTFALMLRKAIDLKADIIVNTDADNQYDQKEIPKLPKPILVAKPIWFWETAKLKNLIICLWLKNTATLSVVGRLECLPVVMFKTLLRAFGPLLANARKNLIFSRHILTPMKQLSKQLIKIWQLSKYR